MSDCRKCAEFSWCLENEDCGLFKQKPQTNADRINAMTVEEKADCLNDIWHHLVFGNDAPGFCGMCHEISISSCRACWMDWLKQEVKEC